MAERARDKKLIRKYERTEVTLDDDQSDEMAKIVDVISNKSSDVLSKIFEEAENEGKSDIKEVWMNDKRSDKAEFERDQYKNCKFVPFYLLKVNYDLNINF